MKDLIEDYLQRADSEAGLQAAVIAEGLQQARESVYREFDAGVAASRLVHDLSDLIDSILQFCFLRFIGEQSQCNCCLIAVGGYGRSELLPGSDIDLMILIDKKPSRQQQQQISEFLTFLWDIGLEVGHSVRTVKDCVREGKADVTVINQIR